MEKDKPEQDENRTAKDLFIDADEDHASFQCNSISGVYNSADH
nr:hypothetical protein [Shuttleworthia satelles]